MIIVDIINSSHVINRTSFHTASGSKRFTSVQQWSSILVFLCFFYLKVCRFLTFFKVFWLPKEMPSGDEDPEAHGCMCGSTNGTYVFNFVLNIHYHWGRYFFFPLFISILGTIVDNCSVLHWNSERIPVWTHLWVGTDHLFVFIVERQKDPIKYCT